MKCPWTKAWPLTSCSACDLWPHKGPTGQWKTYFIISGFNEGRRDDGTRAARKQVVRRRQERTERIQVVLLVLWGSLETSDPVSWRGWRAAHSWPPADAVRTGCTAAPQMSSSSTRLLLVPLNLSQKPRVSPASSAPSSIPSPASCVPA